MKNCLSKEFSERCIQLVKDMKPPSLALVLTKEEFRFKIDGDKTDGIVYYFTDGSCCVFNGNGWVAYR